MAWSSSMSTRDCVVEQHHLVLALHASLPVCVFGDPLQNIFDFGSNVTVKWAKEVVATWPALALPVQPWRWRGHHEDLGQWLIDIRADLYGGRPIDLATAPLSWRRNDTPQAAVSACFAQPTGDGSVVAISKWPHECAAVASKTNGSYGMMEELQGSFMMKFAATVDGGDPLQIAVATVQFAKDCISCIAAKLNRGRQEQAGQRRVGRPPLPARCRGAARPPLRAALGPFTAPCP